MFPGPPETRSHPLFSRRIAAHPHMIPPIPAGIPPTQDPEEPRSVGARPVDDLFMRSRLPLSCLLGGSGLRTRNRSSPRARILVSSDLEGPMYPRGCPMKAPNRALFHSPRHDPPSTRPGPPPTGLQAAGSRPPRPRRPETPAQYTSTPKARQRGRAVPPRRSPRRLPRRPSHPLPRGSLRRGSRQGLPPGCDQASR